MTLVPPENILGHITSWLFKNLFFRTIRNAEFILYAIKTIYVTVVFKI